MFEVAYATLGTVGVERVVIRVLCAHLYAELASRRGLIFRLGADCSFGAEYAILLYLLLQRQTVDALEARVDKTALGKLVHDADDAASTVDVLYVILLRIRSDLANARHLARQSVNVRHLEVDTRLVSHGKQVQDRVGGAAHSYVQRHGVEECLTGGYAARQDALVAVAIVFVSVFNYQFCRVGKKLLALLMRRHNGAVARQGEAYGLIEAVHRVGREHARARAARRAGALLHLGHLIVGERRVGTLDHRVYEVKLLVAHASSLHRPSGAEDRRYVQPHGGYEHARRNLVAIGYAYHRVGLMRVDHVLDAVGNDVSRRQGVKHAVMPHGYAIVYGYGVELGGIAASLLYLRLDVLPNLVQMRMAWHELREGVDDGDDGFPHLLFFHAVGHPQGAGACHAATLRCGRAAKFVLILYFICHIMLFFVNALRLMAT